jgi:hypothetical protein
MVHSESTRPPLAIIDSQLPPVDSAPSSRQASLVKVKDQLQVDVTPEVGSAQQEVIEGIERLWVSMGLIASSIS